MTKSQNSGNELLCPHCFKTYVRPLSFEKHQCKKKIDAPEIERRAYNLWKFWTQYNEYRKTDIDYPDFKRSPFWKYFIKLAFSIQNVYMFDDRDYIIWLSQKKISAKDWDKPIQVEKYKKEAATRGKGVERVYLTLESIILWCDQHNMQAEKFPDEFPPKELVRWVEVGKMSPWYLLLTKERDRYFSRLNDQELYYMLSVINLDYWEGRFKRESDETAEVRRILFGTCL